MVRRDKRNIGKRVRVVQPGSAWDGREGIVKSFRGDMGTRDGQVIPYVVVYFPSLKFAYPRAGHQLEYVKTTEERR